MSDHFAPSKYWRLQKTRYGLVGEVCGQGHPIFPPRDVCPDCSEEAKTPYQFSGKGEIYSFTTVYEAPEGFEEQAPYTVALVKLNEGPLVTAQLTDLEMRTVATPDGLGEMRVPIVEIGQIVEMVTRKLREDGERGMLVYGYKFRPREFGG